MARKKTPKVRVHLKASLSRRLREIRQEIFGEHGGPELARRLGLPARTWYNYETGVTVPAEVLLSFIEQTGVNPMYLISGEGPRYRLAERESSFASLTPLELIRRGLEQLERTPSDGVLLGRPSGPHGEDSPDFAAVTVFPPEQIAGRAYDPSRAEGQVMAFRRWIPNPSQTVGMRLRDDAMSPILPHGSVAAIDTSVTDPRQLHGRIVAARVEGEPVIRWLEVSGRHIILRPNSQSREFPLVPRDLDTESDDLILGQVVWSWSLFREG
ncbi:helix-turn-helix domain-containing protein [Aquisphaera insulae]|uniref:helix-turn-helix domain-containing protein n=1 Tax=Aquisphaera insulae TaxID=2712864 RepID=UPI0013EA6C72|nr:S24 family peptidase [Aquisphaera insulae]